MKIKKYLYGNPLLAAIEQLRNLTSLLVGNIVDNVANQSREAENRIKVLNKANVTANKKTKAPMKTNELAVLQDKLWNLGAFKGIKNRQGKDVTYEQAVDGLIGNMTRLALANAKLMGHNFDGYDINEKSGLVTKKTPRRKSIIDNSKLDVITYSPSAGVVTINSVNKNLPYYEKTIPTLTEDEARKIYQKGPGKRDIYFTALYHALTPESWGVPHSEGLKNQVAAEIAYTEGLPETKREKDPYNVNGQTYIGYATHGKLSGQSSNINEQGDQNNATSKVMGGLRYRKNEDGSVDVIDPYTFNVVRDFTRKNKHGNPYVYNSGEDPYQNHPWKGLYHDLVTPGEGKSLQNMFENFASRQGKTRSNNIHFESGEINRRVNNI